MSKAPARCPVLPHLRIRSILARENSKRLLGSKRLLLSEAKRESAMSAANFKRIP